jgi:DNA-binding NtrC family response regulator
MRDTRSVIAGILLGVSPAMEKLRGEIACISPLRTPVLVQGPTGAGKELVATALHAASGRRGKLVAVNASAVPGGMFEALMFGYTRGAFTGAITNVQGYLAAANGGTLLLDEVNALAIDLQPKLLRALETRCFQRLGDHHETFSDFRLVTATNVTADVLRRSAQFRDDLLYRLAGIVLSVPPLASRREDVAVLARYFLGATSHGKPRELSAGALTVLEEYEWPGNVRQLRHVIERADAFAAGHLILADDIARALQMGDNWVPRASVQERVASELRDALETTGGNITAAALLLGVHRTTVHRWLARHRFSGKQWTGSEGSSGDVSPTP